MTDEGREHPATYTVGYGKTLQQNLARRRAADSAAFFVPPLRPGMDVLDVGCGPATITLDLADLVAPGMVVGVDIAPVQVERGRELAAERDVTNTRFEVGDACRLPFPDSSFDALYANMVLMYLKDPTAALREFRRVLRPGGVCGIRDFTGLMWWEPETPLLARFWSLFMRQREYALGRRNNELAFRQRQLLRAAGFTRTEGDCEWTGSGDPERPVRAANNYAALCRASPFRDSTLALGWTTEAELEAMAAELTRWGSDPDAMGGGIVCAALGWVEVLHP